MENDWRLTNQTSYLYKKRLVKKLFISSDMRDHEHCSFCWYKFYEPNVYGYCTLDGQHWICEECFGDFKEVFKWEIENTGDGSLC